MMRNAQNVIGTGGQSSRGTVSSPVIGASGSMFQNQRAQFRNPERIFQRAGLPCRAARTGISGAPSGSLWK